MVRAALASNKRIGQGPRSLARVIPAASVVFAILLSALPIVSTSGWYPDFGFLTLIAWRLLRSDPWPAWWAAPLGLVNDLIIGWPVGQSIAFWSATMLVLDLVDRRTIWRDYWIEWAVACLLLLINAWVQWWIAATVGADLPFRSAVPALLISIFVFPIAAWTVSRIDRWRLGR
ncbi:MAG: rod shape-determining protein MreD [Sphingomicrobium sp.]